MYVAITVQAGSDLGSPQEPGGFCGNSVPGKIGESQHLGAPWVSAQNWVLDGGGCEEPDVSHLDSQLV